MKPKIAVIVGSVRKNRFAEKPARWILGLLQQRDDLDAELLDLAEYPMPFFDEPRSPAARKGPAENEVVERFRQKIAAADGFVVVTLGCEIGPSAVVKNAILDKRCRIPDGMTIGVDRAADEARFHVTEKGRVLVVPEMLEAL